MKEVGSNGHMIFGRGPKSRRQETPVDQKKVLHDGLVGLQVGHDPYPHRVDPMWFSRSLVSFVCLPQHPRQHPRCAA